MQPLQCLQHHEHDKQRKRHKSQWPSAALAESTTAAQTIGIMIEVAATIAVAKVVLVRFSLPLLSSFSACSSLFVVHCHRRRSFRRCRACCPQSLGPKYCAARLKHMVLLVIVVVLLAVLHSLSGGVTGCCCRHGIPACRAAQRCAHYFGPCAP